MKTQNPRANPYAELGKLISRLRMEAGLAQQIDLAGAVGTTQQTISRWESGQSRPRAGQIPAVAAALKVDSEKLLHAAGYAAPSTTVANFDKPFPVDALNPESFERFCAYLIAELYPEGAVHRAGESGHKQDGLDIEVKFPNGEQHYFQCKRVDEFGPQKVHAAVALLSKAAREKFILLSRVASPQARDAITQHDGWDIWDKEDVSQKIRQLSKDAQRRIVDTFFRGQRLALLGESEGGPWLTIEEFFAPFTANKAFGHSWNLVGREEELKKLTTEITTGSAHVIFLVGSGGAGKTKLLKQALEKVCEKERSLLIRALSPTEQATTDSITDLGEQQKILVVDDAHDRSDIMALLQHTAVANGKTKLVLACRQYGLDFLKARASNFGLAGDLISDIILKPLNLEQATALAQQVLKKLGGSIEAAKDIARMTLDCPLATVIGAQIVAKEKIHAEFIKNEELFRTTLIGKFQTVIIGEVGQKNESEQVRKLLQILALVQPFHPEDQELLSAIENAEGIKPYQSNRLIKLLIDAGVLFQRGRRYRLSPDYLADHIIENVCVGHNYTSTGYAEHLFDLAKGESLQNILVNLGKLDWRLKNGDSTNSQLIAGIWKKLNPVSEYSDPHLNAVVNVAYYQPDKALSFVERFKDDKRFGKELPRICKYAAYNMAHLPRACELLWELGKNDSRLLNQHPDHPIRILSELSEVQPGKPRDFNDRVVDFGLSLLDRDDSWRSARSPLEILDGALKADGHQTTSHGKSISFQKFGVNHKFIAPVRAKVIDATLKLIRSDNARIAFLAAEFLSDSLRYPMNSGESRDSWTKEFTETINKAAATIDSTDVHPLVKIAIAKSVSWHANYSKGSASDAAKILLQKLPNDIRFRAFLFLTDGYGNIHRILGKKSEQEKWNKEMTSLAKELVEKHTRANALQERLDEYLNEIKAIGDGSLHQAQLLIARVLNFSNDLAKEIGESALRDDDRPTRKYVSTSLAKVMMEDHHAGLKLAKRFLESDSNDLKIAVGEAYNMLPQNEFQVLPEDVANVRILLSSADDSVVLSANRSVLVVAEKSSRLAIDLVLGANFTEKTVDQLLSTFVMNETVKFDDLNKSDVVRILSKLSSLNELEGHWTETFLAYASEHYGLECSQFFRQRVERAVLADDYSIRPCNHGPYGNVPLLFRKSPDFAAIFIDMSRWMKSNAGNSHFRLRSGELFQAMFAPFDESLVSALNNWLDMATEEDLRALAVITKEASMTFVFEHRDFVVRMLERAHSFGPECYEESLSAAYESAAFGERQGTPGEPFPEDLRMRDSSEESLKALSPHSPAYKLYEMLKKRADREIQESLEEAKEYEE